ncbi:Fe-only nitrogenase accessory protein AnfO [Blastochloris viridis]|uniref:AnfO protein n=1 Tax=Blastochloris viridis TaxID=1079 RepID=A0A0H5BE88_BLAVI|nr:Fe-only nitrogenase accessory protein AnfO [Blastochloris viridis]ALK10660.1 Iron only nitrogenase protein AnfO (AnfO_nitrog) [Blastochloris viridis]BAR99379.1 AnfO protein [Blastochloris viridis]CUU43323.1 Fe-only nitrogenase accessory protein AnfO [Blastochloris viridis]
MRIAAFIDENGALAGLHQHGCIVLYDDASGAWTVQRDIPFPGAGVPATIAGLKARLIQAVGQFDDCNVFVSAGSKGALSAILQDELGFQTWQSQGFALDVLDAVALKESERLAEIAAAAVADDAGEPPTLVLERVGAEHYRADLTRFQNPDGSHDSMAVLLPVLQQRGFRRLELVCDHNPKWLWRTVRELGLKLKREIVMREGVMSTITICAE